MRKNRLPILFTLVLLCCLSRYVKAQEEVSQKNLSVGYYAPLPLEYGVRVSYTNQLFKNSGPRFTLNSGIGFFAKGHDNSNFVIGTELGYNISNPEGKNAHVFSLGAAYQHQLEVTEFTVNFQGDIIDKSRSPRAIFLPSVNYMYQRRVSKLLNPYFKLIYGYKLSSSIDPSGVLMWEFGNRFNF